MPLCDGQLPGDLVARQRRRRRSRAPAGCGTKLGQQVVPDRGPRRSGPEPSRGEHRSDPPDIADRASTRVPSTNRYTEKYHNWPGANNPDEPDDGKVADDPGDHGGGHGLADPVGRQAEQLGMVQRVLELREPRPGDGGNGDQEAEADRPDRREAQARAEAIVSPLRLTPGKGANIWARPIRRASSQVVSRGTFRPRGAFELPADQQQDDRR